MSEDRYVVIEITGEIPDIPADTITHALMQYAGQLATAFDVDLFAMRPHAHQEQVMRELFGEGEPDAD